MESNSHDPNPSIGELGHELTDGNNNTLVESGPTDLEVQRKPWKFVGYRRYAEFISSDDDFFILRRFNTLNVRITLALQDQISVLEEQLEALDKQHSAKSATDINNGTFRGDIEERELLIHQITEALSQYNDAILQQSRLRKHPKAPKRDIKNIKNWHFNHDNRAISEAEQEYLYHEDDLICVVEKEKPPLRRAIDNSRWLRTLEFWKSQDNITVPDYEANNIAYYSDQRIDRFVSVFIVFAGTVMLITPIWILQALTDVVMKLTVITVFIFAALLFMSFFMVTKPFEALGATAAYAAILMVFIQVGSN
ncbi:hypothetical protein F4810DRAFT_725541 [Camillea tinctor]|nr:hypothetical protein F4810DRAFT_725541 [Camillea tinctor]